MKSLQVQALEEISRMSHRQRVERRDEKRTQVLSVLRSIGWINVEAACELLGVSRPAATRTIKGLEADGFLCSHALPGVPKRIWYSITERGMAEAYFVEGLPLPERIPSGRWKISLLNYQHEQDVLVFAIQVQKAGARVRLSEQSVPGQKGRAISAKYPDLLVDAGNETFGVEMEREVKSQRRYREIIAAHWHAMERGEYQVVLYLTPKQATRDRLARVVKSVYESVRLGGRVRALTEEERQRIRFGTYQGALGFIQGKVPPKNAAGAE